VSVLNASFAMKCIAVRTTRRDAQPKASRKRTLHITKPRMCLPAQMARSSGSSGVSIKPRAAVLPRTRNVCTDPEIRIAPLVLWRINAARNPRLKGLAVQSMNMRVS